MRRLLGRFLCLIGDHDWTSRALQGFEPAAEDLRDGYAGFVRYARMYCSRCGFSSRIRA